MVSVTGSNRGLDWTGSKSITCLPPPAQHRSYTPRWGDDDLEISKETSQEKKNMAWTSEPSEAQNHVRTFHFQAI